MNGDIELFLCANVTMRNS